MKFMKNMAHTQQEIGLKIELTTKKLQLTRIKSSKNRRGLLEVCSSGLMHDTEVDVVNKTQQSNF